ncbi:phosphoglycerate kinase [Chlamydia abortus]|uniref:Phosphoglycerate kinase n=1 Tax=Chlamydia abortus (strain DSM 27085 / S26/3) TaxID=218497 RepID=PGK_CHLAB|nr:phosphoglycerate kinase [Chlamydia abortus]Q5L748.1 RecName: Full=Phosphoglycerate kinase [Chlamydia abortus S26/3]AUS59486.1 phosphoglycerate kinase [Chlamydia abortus]QEM73448.1 phosphoglycerate kinase [Chlamydia abortus]CAH63520.1 putative phosphoglycerate kinase [Chlamydia abortus S26/3]SFV98679.1 phosphoglycerate kinase [Chlamydia abortus]SFV98979.1 phosphoglycerate kinase [Chlamydia abortus]
MDRLTVRELSPEEKKVLVRVDFNVPIKDGKILDDIRIRSAMPTIHYLLQKRAAVILMSHLGRPQGKGFEEKYSLQPVVEVLEGYLGHHVPLAPDCVGEVARQAVAQISPGRVLLLENLRFHPGEEHPEEHPAFAAELSSYGDFYVNDAFGTSHRKHASVYTVPQAFPGRSAAGLLMEKELEFLGQHLLISPKRPFTAILGGSKVSSKIGVIEALLSQVDNLLLAGGMGFTFLKALGKSVGNSLVEESGIELARRVLHIAQQRNVRIVLPIDVKVAKACTPAVSWTEVSIDQGIPQDLEGLDIGTKTVQEFCKIIDASSTIFWNGPVGVYEVPPFDQGSMAIANCLARHPSAITVVGGGDAAAVVALAGCTAQVSHVSTGGGASLEFLEKGFLPGTEVLSPSQE